MQGVHRIRTELLPIAFRLYLDAHSCQPRALANSRIAGNQPGIDSLSRIVITDIAISVASRRRSIVKFRKLSFRLARCEDIQKPISMLQEKMQREWEENKNVDTQFLFRSSKFDHVSEARANIFCIGVR